MIQSLDVNLRMFCYIRDAALELNHRSEKVDSYSSEISKKNWSRLYRLKCKYTTKPILDMLLIYAIYSTFRDNQKLLLKS